MNGWDLFTWINAIALLVSSVVIFFYFLRDARKLLQGERQDNNEET
jgi:TRAP-type C4-dicarboxylate transport system permease small subunit